MSLLGDVQAVVASVDSDADLNALRYPLQAAWSDGVTRQFGVRDPNRGNGGRGLLKLQTDPMPASLRLLRLAPGQSEPTPGTSVPHQGGQLVFGVWSDESQYTARSVGVCRLVDARAYPVQATAAGQSVRLRVQATATLPGGAQSGNDLAESVNDSHRAHLPPGVTLDPGTVISTEGGDEYEVVPPIQRDTLGDTLGLSWRGRTGARSPTPGNDPTPDPGVPVTPHAIDPWWNQ